MSIRYYIETVSLANIASLPTDVLFQRYKMLAAAVVSQENNTMLESASWILKAHFAHIVHAVDVRVKELPMNVLLCYARNQEEEASDTVNRPIFCLTIKEICMKEILRRYFRDSICNSSQKK